MSGSVLVARALLERLEWSGAVLRLGMPVNACPICKAACDMTKPNPEHADGCELAAVIASPPHDCNEQRVADAIAAYVTGGIDGQGLTMQRLGVHIRTGRWRKP